ncbi:MAG TPA: thioesterase family protein [Motilibacteraceae bacterium]|nr:thioesterase family protein [Motilibacteraceae bacterium]
MDAFYEQLDETRFRASEATTGPWAPGLQHGGPPSALLVRALERLPGLRPAPDGGPTPGRLVRVTTDFLSPVPVADVEVRARVLRDGRQVQLLEAELVAAGRTVLRSTGWRVRTLAPGDTPAVAVGAHHDVAPLPPSTAAPVPGFSFPYAKNVEWRFAVGDPLTPGPATAWARLRVPLVAGEQVSPVQQVIAVTDSGSGVSAALSWDDWSFVNTELSVHLARVPRADWVCLDARTHLEPDGTGLARTTLHDLDGWFGETLQSLVVSPR